MRKRVWFVYIPEEGDWKLAYTGKNERVARNTYLRWARRKRLPAGAKIWSMLQPATNR